MSPDQIAMLLEEADDECKTPLQYCTLPAQRVRELVAVVREQSAEIEKQSEPTCEERK